MKTIRKLTVSFCLWFAVEQLVKCSAQGFIVPNGVSYGGLDQTFGYRINVVHDPSNSNPLYSTNTQFFLNPVGKSQPTAYTNTFNFQQFADIGVRVFLVSSNDPISLQQITSQTYSELQFGNNYIFKSGQPFYVGLYTGASFAPPYPPNPPYIYTDPVFGWAELENVQGTIQLLGGAAEYQGGGIFAGTETIIPVPEPSSAVLLLRGGVTFALFLKRKAAQTFFCKIFWHQTEGWVGHSMLR